MLNAIGNYRLFMMIFGLWFLVKDKGPLGKDGPFLDAVDTRWFVSSRPPFLRMLSLLFVAMVRLRQRGCV